MGMAVLVLQYLPDCLDRLGHRLRRVIADFQQRIRAVNADFFYLGLPVAAIAEEAACRYQKYYFDNSHIRRSGHRARLPIRE